MERNDNENVDQHDESRTTGDEVGEAAGGISGVVAGAAIGSVGGPVGTIIGGIAGAIGGWWAGHAVAEAANNYTRDDDTFYRSHYEHSDNRLADRSYDDVRPAYQLGHLAARNPDYTGRPFESVESDLRRGWDNNASKAHGDWNQVKDYARTGFTRSSLSNNTSESERERLDDAANDADNRLDDAAGYRPF